MNRYHLEVAKMDRRHHLLVRGASFGGAAALIVAALWSAGLPSSEWLKRAQAWFTEPDTAADQGLAADAAPTDNPSTQPASRSIPSAELLPGTDSSVSPSPQPLLLVSTLPGRNSNEGTAQIGTNPDNPQTYVGGAILANGARLAEIHTDRVVLARDGRRFALYLHGKGKSAAEPTSTLAVVGGDAPSTPQHHLATDHLTDVIRSSPYYENDSLIGLQVYPGRKSGAFAQLGLKAGDLIVAIEGAPVADASSASELLRTLLEGAALTVDVRRANERSSIALDGEIVRHAIAPPEPTPPSMM